MKNGEIGTIQSYTHFNTLVIRLFNDVFFLNGKDKYSKIDRLEDYNNTYVKLLPKGTEIKLTIE